MSKGILNRNNNETPKEEERDLSKGTSTRKGSLSEKVTFGAVIK